MPMTGEQWERFNGLAARLLALRREFDDFLGGLAEDARWPVRRAAAPLGRAADAAYQTLTEGNGPCGTPSETTAP